jgi:two-component sensor histidine kinase
VTFPGDRPAGPDRLRIVVEDDGQGIAEDFSIETTTSLGLQIVRSLVAGELDGTLAIGPRRGGGTQVVLQFDVPVD